MRRSDAQLRKTLVEACHILDHEGLVHGYGHVSARAADGKTILISPRKGPRLVRAPDEIARITMSGLAAPERAKKGKPKGAVARVEAPLELFAHTEVYRLRPDVNAICRVHGKFSLVLSALKRTLRPVHELAVALGREVRLFDNPELIATAEMGRHMASALGAGRALLMRGNGQLTVGGTIEEAVVRAILMEVSAEAQWRALCIGEPAWIEGEEYTRLTQCKYENVLRPWNYYLSRLRSH